MPTSINGLPVLDNPPWGDPRARKDKTPCGTDLWVRAELWPLFAAISTDWNNTIRPIHSTDGYDYRQAHAASAWSDHSSASAVDHNADAEGQQGTGMLWFWKRWKNRRAITRIIKTYGVVMWGGPDICNDAGTGYTQPGNYDPMHIAIAKGISIEEVQAKIQFLGIDHNGIRHNNAKGLPLRKPITPK